MCVLVGSRDQVREGILPAAALGLCEHLVGGVNGFGALLWWEKHSQWMTLIAGWAGMQRETWWWLPTWVAKRRARVGATKVFLTVFHLLSLFLNRVPLVSDFESRCHEYRD